MATPALQAKERGNKAYKAKKFEEAVKHYDEAISLDATDITFYTNKGGELSRDNPFCCHFRTQF